MPCIIPSQPNVAPCTHGYPIVDMGTPPVEQPPNATFTLKHASQTPYPPCSGTSSLPVPSSNRTLLPFLLSCFFTAEGLATSSIAGALAVRLTISQPAGQPGVSQPYCISSSARFSWNSGTS